MSLAKCCNFKHLAMAQFYPNPDRGWLGDDPSAYYPKPWGGGPMADPWRTHQSDDGSATFFNDFKQLEQRRTKRTV